MKECEHGVNQLTCVDPACVLEMWGPPIGVVDLVKYPPDDVITGYPDHYIINGDPSSCGCPEHRHLYEAEGINKEEVAPWF